MTADKNKQHLGINTIPNIIRIETIIEPRIERVYHPNTSPTQIAHNPHNHITHKISCRDERYTIIITTAMRTKDVDLLINLFTSIRHDWTNYTAISHTQYN